MGPYVAAAMGMALAAYEVRDKERMLFAHMERAAYTLSHARPTTMARMIRVTERALNIVKDSIEKDMLGLPLVEALQANALDQVNHNYYRMSLSAPYLADKYPWVVL